MTTKFRGRQTISRDLLDQLTTVAGRQLDFLLSSIDSELTPPLRMMPSSPADLTVSVDDISVTNPETGKQRTIPPIDGTTLPVFTSGTIVFPAAPGGSVVVTPGDDLLFPATPASEYIKAGVSLDTAGNLIVTFGDPGATPDLATTPPAITGTFTIGHIVLQNLGGTIQNVDAADIFQYVGGGGSGGTGDTTEVLETIKNYLNDSFYSLAAHTIFKTDADGLIDGTSTGAYSLTNKTFELGTSEFMLSSDLLDTDEFVNLGKAIDKADVAVFWDVDFIDDAATYQISRDGGGHYTTLDMERVGEAGANFYGAVEFAPEQDVFQTFFSTSTNTVELTNVAGTNESLGQRFTFTEETDLYQFSLMISRIGTIAGTYTIKVVADDGSNFPQSSSVLFSGEATSASTVQLDPGDEFPTVTLEPRLTLPAGTYHVIIETDATYKASYSAGVNALLVRGSTSGQDGSASREDGGVWSSIANSKFRYIVTGFVASNDLLIGSSGTDTTFALNTTTQQEISQKFNVNSLSIVRQINLSLTKTGSPVGNAIVSITTNSGGFPTDEVLSSSVATAISGLTTGDNIINVSEVILSPGVDYHFVIETDAAYKASFSAGVTQLAINALNAGFYLSTYNGTTWSDGSAAAEYEILGTPLELVLKITASQASALEGFAVFYDDAPGVTPTGILNVQRFHFNSVTDNDNEFVLTQFVPHPDLLQVHYVQGGQTFVVGAFEINGQKITFPVDTFNNGGVSAPITLVFDQTRGGAFDNSDLNASLLAANHLGSTDGGEDRSVPGRGLFLRRPDGTLREIAIDDSDNIVVYSV